ncbi:phosphate transport regulator [Sulfolobales archaeon HS-7]|nr:phosphate transport regulator [Sulfolobales archaeon HS-7]
MVRIFKITREDEIFKRLLAISVSLKEMSSSLRSLYMGVRNGDKNDSIGNSVRIRSAYERVAMEREDVMSLLFGEAFLPDFKESMVMLTQSLYYTSKAIKDTARAYVTRRVSEKCLQSMGDQMEAYLVIVSEATSKMVDVVNSLNHDIRRAIKLGREIQMLERNGDEIKDTLLLKLYEIESEIDVVSLLQFKDIILFTDDILDNLEEGTVSVEVLYATLKS